MFNMPPRETSIPHGPTGRLNLKGGNSLPHECRWQCLFTECMSGIILTPMISGREWHGQVFCNGLGLSLGVKLSSTSDWHPNILKEFTIFPKGGDTRDCAAYRTNRWHIAQTGYRYSKACQ